MFYGFAQEKSMINTLKSLSGLGVLVAVVWFFMRPDFAAVLTGILSLSVFMMTLLPITSTSDNQV